MFVEKHSSLREMYQSLSDEAEALEKGIRKNLFRISEIEEYLSSIYEKEDVDFKVFSPRNVESIYGEDINNHKSEKHKLEIDNRSLYSKLNKVNSYLEDLESVIKESSAKEKDDKNAIALNLSILEIQEKERQRIARDLHDTSLQNLSHMIHKIELASMYIEKDTIQARLELASVNKNLKAVIDEIRNTIFDLRPMHFDDLGLKDCLERLFVRLKENNSSFDFEVEMDEIVCDNDMILMTIFRVVQEACSNAIKHSAGNKIKIIMKQKDKCCDILLKDNGKGFSVKEIEDKDDRHFGITVMKERVFLLGGNIQFHSVFGEGTEIKINIPLE